MWHLRFIVKLLNLHCSGKISSLPGKYVLNNLIGQLIWWSHNLTLYYLVSHHGDSGLLSCVWWLEPGGPGGAAWCRHRVRLGKLETGERGRGGHRHNTIRHSPKWQQSESEEPELLSRKGEKTNGHAALKSQYSESSSTAWQLFKLKSSVKPRLN